jgi:hypothetical protein
VIATDRTLRQEPARTRFERTPRERANAPESNGAWKNLLKKTARYAVSSLVETAIQRSAGFIRIGAVLLLASVVVCNGWAQDEKPPEFTSPFPEDAGVMALNLATNAEQAWILIKEMKPLPPKSKQSQMESSAIAADMCREFVKRYRAEGFNRPKQAVQLRYQHLIRTIELGNTNRIDEFEGMVHPRFLLQNHQKWGFADLQELFPRRELDLARMRAFRAFPEGFASVRREWEKNLRQFDLSNPEVAYELLLLAEQSEPEHAKRLAEELLQTTAGKSLKERAKTLLGKHESLGKPVSLKATAMDGKPVDSEQWKGKVVLLHFWTPPPPHNPGGSIDPSGIAAAKAVYEEFHDRGLEVLSINLARNQKVLNWGGQNLKTPWPHYWASTNLSADLRAAAGVPPGHTLSQTTFALLDRNAVLRDRDIPRQELSGRIQRLLK